MRGAALLLLLTLTGCGGWHLRGSAGGSLEGLALAVDAPGQPQVAAALAATLARSEAHVVEDPAAADALVRVLSVTESLRVLSVGERLEAREYELSQFLRFEIVAADGEVVRDPEVVTVSGAFDYDPDDVLGSDARRSELRETLLRDAIRLLMARVSAALGQRGAE